eukprot:348871_1
MTTVTEYKEHVVLLGDSILDNSKYVKHGSPAVIDQLTHKGKTLNWKTTNCAVDGARTIDLIKHYIDTIPKDTTYIVLSIGGNDGLKSLGKIAFGISSIWLPWNMYSLFMETKQTFNKRYSEALQKIKLKCPNAKIIVCTVYYPFFPTNVIIQSIANIGINILSGVIIKNALKYGNIPVIDIRYVFDKKEDYANSIEPGVPGGDKLINNVANIIHSHDFNKIYTKQEDIIYKSVTYSNNVNPYDYKGNYWKMQSVDKQQGSQATIFFRRAFDERKNANIKLCAKITVFLCVSTVIGCVGWKYGYVQSFKFW